MIYERVHAVRVAGTGLGSVRVTLVTAMHARRPYSRSRDDTIADHQRFAAAAQETVTAGAPGTLAGSAARVSSGISDAEPMDRHSVFPVRPVLRNRRTIRSCRASRGGRRLAADRLSHEFEGAAGDGTPATNPSGGNAAIDRVSVDIADIPEELLRLAVPRGDHFRISVE